MSCTLTEIDRTGSGRAAIADACIREARGVAVCAQRDVRERSIRRATERGLKRQGNEDCGRIETRSVIIDGTRTSTRNGGAGRQLDALEGSAAWMENRHGRSRICARKASSDI